MIKNYTLGLIGLFLSLSLASQDAKRCDAPLEFGELLTTIVSPFDNAENGLIVFEYFGAEVGYFYEVRNLCPNLPTEDRPLPPGFENYNGSFYTCDGSFICNYGVDRPVTCDPKYSATNIDLLLATERSIVYERQCTYAGYIINTCRGDEIKIETPKDRPFQSSVPGVPKLPVCEYDSGLIFSTNNVDQFNDGVKLTTLSNSSYRIRLESDLSCGPLEYVYTINVDPNCGNQALEKPALFEKYPWVSNLVEYADCSNASIDVYDQDGTNFLFIREGESYKLYDAAGNLYCSDRPDFSCLRNYDLTDVVDSWVCDISEEEDIFATICPGDPLPQLLARAGLGDAIGGPCGPTGPIGSPPTICPCRNVSSVDIIPKQGVVSDLIDGRFFSVAPLSTTTYTITSTTGPGGPGITCRSETFSLTYKIVVKAPGECDGLQNCPCDDVYDPVCGVDGISYSNPCEAACVGVDYVSGGECESTTATPAFFDDYPFILDAINVDDCDGSAVDVYDSGTSEFVFIRTSEFGQLYLNGKLHCSDSQTFSCIQFYRLAAPIHSWRCGDTIDCLCPQNANPVCGADGNSYNNACEAACHGVDVIGEGLCEEPCLCTAEYDPVCGADGNTYSNACVAGCAGIELISKGPCEEDCNCTLEYNPVCGADGNTYSNSCFAACAGIEIVREGECAPVSVCDDMTGTVLFQNCDDGRLFFFFLLESGEIVDPYLADGLDFEFFEGQEVRFNATDADFDSPCSIASRAIVLDCVEEIMMDNNEPDCYNHFGNIISGNCGNGESTLLLEFNDIIYFPYYINGVTFEPSDGQSVRFDFIEADVTNVCEAAQQAIFITCMEEDIPDDSFIGLPELIRKLVAPENCDDTRIRVFDADEGQRVYIEANGIGTLYDLNGGFLCSDGGAISCLSSYGLEISILDIKCSELNLGDGIVDDFQGFELYPWARNIIDQQDCDGSLIEIYDTGAFAYVYIQNGDEGTLYFEDGSTFCKERDNFSCREAYNLDGPTSSWKCSDDIGGGLSDDNTDDGNSSTFNQTIESCPGILITIQTPIIGQYNNDANIDTECPPFGENAPCPCSLVTDVQFTPEIGIINYDTNTGIIEIMPESEIVYTMTVATGKANPDSPCTPEKYQQVFTINLDGPNCDSGLQSNESSVESRSGHRKTESRLTVFPNPASDHITVRGYDEVNGTLYVRNIIGKEMYRFDITGDTERKTIDISSLEAGVYLLTWETPTGMESRKFIVQ